MKTWSSGDAPGGFFSGATAVSWADALAIVAEVPAAPTSPRQTDSATARTLDLPVDMNS